MDWFTIDIAKTSKCYDYNQWTCLVSYVRDDKTFYIIKGGDHMGKYEEIEIIVEANSITNGDDLEIDVLRLYAIYTMHDKTRGSMDIALFERFFRDTIREYVFKNNLMFRHGTVLSQPNPKILKLNANEIPFDNNDLDEIRKANSIIIKCHHNNLQLNFDHNKAIVMSHTKLSTTKCIKCSQYMGLEEYYFFEKFHNQLKDKFPGYTCKKCWCSCTVIHPTYFKGELRKCQKCDKSICDSCSKDELCRSVCNRVTTDDPTPFLLKD